MYRTLIDADALAALLEQGSVALFDCRFDLATPDQGERDYREGHVPGAVYASLDADLSDLARQAASALYHLVSLAAMRSEARHAGLERRNELADLVLQHRLAPRDPCAAAEPLADCGALLAGRG